MEMMKRRSLNLCPLQKQHINGFQPSLFTLFPAKKSIRLSKHKKDLKSPGWHVSSFYSINNSKNDKNYRNNNNHRSGNLKQQRFQLQQQH
jgi:hypothetical protein